MSDVTGGSEFDGVPQANTIMPPVTPKGTPGHTELPGHEKMRLDYLTGQHEDTTAAPDGGLAWEGLTELEAIEPELYRDRFK